MRRRRDEFQNSDSPGIDVAELLSANALPRAAWLGKKSRVGGVR